MDVLLSIAVIPGWCDSIRPGISRFRIRADARPGMTTRGVNLPDGQISEKAV